MMQLRQLDASITLGKVVWHDVEDFPAGHQERACLVLPSAVYLEHLAR